MNSVRALCQRSITPIAGISLLMASVLSIASAAEGAETPHSSIGCSAHVNIPRPTDYSTVTIVIHTKGSARVTTTAHYRTTTNIKSTVASPSGSASVAYRISRATSGFQVVVTVTVRLGSSTGACRTSFTPV